MNLQESKLYSINGTALPSPSGTSVGWEDVHDPNSGRTLDAEMHITIVARKRKVELKYDILTQNQMQQLQALLDGTYYQLSYFDPLYGQHTIKCYVSSTSQELYNALLYKGLWRNVSFSAIEV